MSDNRQRTLSRDVTASQIPSGDKHTLFANTSVFIHQVLGGSYTVQTDTGLYRLDGKDADAIGETVKDQKVAGGTLADGSPLVGRAITYVADETNPNWLGDAPLSAIAAQIREARGPSGPNVEYVLGLHDVLEKSNIHDPHVAELAALLTAV